MEANFKEQLNNFQKMADGLRENIQGLQNGLGSIIGKEEMKEVNTFVKGFTEEEAKELRSKASNIDPAARKIVEDLLKRNR